MTADNLTFALEIDFIPDLQEGRDDFKKKMKSVAEKIDGSYTLDQKSRPIISGLTKEDIEKVLTELGLLAFGMWPSCILTCSVTTALPMRAVGMSDGWDIYTGKKDFLCLCPVPCRCAFHHGQSLYLLPGSRKLPVFRRIYQLYGI